MGLSGPNSGHAAVRRWNGCLTTYHVMLTCRSAGGATANLFGTQASLRRAQGFFRKVNKASFKVPQRYYACPTSLQGPIRGNASSCQRVLANFQCVVFGMHDPRLHGAFGVERYLIRMRRAPCAPANDKQSVPLSLGPHIIPAPRSVPLHVVYQGGTQRS